MTTATDRRVGRALLSQRVTRPGLVLLVLVALTALAMPVLADHNASTHPKPFVDPFGVAPNVGAPDAETPVRIHGSGFSAGAVSVTFGGAAASDVTVVEYGGGSPRHGLATLSPAPVQRASMAMRKASKTSSARMWSANATPPPPGGEVETVVR